MCFKSYRLSTNSIASQSSSSGCDGGLRGVKLSDGFTSPTPISFSHSRLTVTLAKYGLSRWVIKSARPARPLPFSDFAPVMNRPPARRSFDTTSIEYV